LDQPLTSHRHLYLGLSLFNLDKYEESEDAYQRAIQIEAEERQRKDRKENPASWQGLLKLYEAQKRVDEYIDTAVRLSSIFRDQDERVKSLGVIEKAVAFAQEHGSKTQYKRALRVMLPGSPVFDYLDGLIPRADHTYLKLAELIEAEEKEKINKEIANRRSRLGAVLGQVTTEVRREVWGASPLEELYQNILNWSDDEELRRQIDCRLLQHAYNKLLVFPKENKLEQRVKVESWARGLVILKHPFELAWRIVIEWKDCETIGIIPTPAFDVGTPLRTAGDQDINLLREYVNFFPDSGLAISLRAYLDSEISPFPSIPDGEYEEGSQEVEPSSTKGAEEDEITDQRLYAMIVISVSARYQIWRTDVFRRTEPRRVQLQYCATAFWQNITFSSTNTKTPLMLAGLGSSY
jgi:superkiller protein 3